MPMIDRTGRLRERLTYANVMSTLAVFGLLGGGAYAAATIGPDDIEKDAVRSKHVRPNSLKGTDLKDGTLLESDFADGELPAGAQGPAGPQGAPGTDGDDGSDGQQGPPGPTEGFVQNDTNTATPSSNSSAAVNKNITTTVAGPLFVFGRLSGFNISGCAVGETPVVALYVDGVPVPETTYSVPVNVPTDISTFGTTASLPAGTHAIAMRHSGCSGTVATSRRSEGAAVGAIVLGG